MLSSYALNFSEYKPIKNNAIMCMGTNLCLPACAEPSKSQRSGGSSGRAFGFGEEEG